MIVKSTNTDEYNIILNLLYVINYQGVPSDPSKTIKLYSDENIILYHLSLFYFI